MQEHEAESRHEEEEQVENDANGSGSLSSEEAEHNPLSPARGRVMLGNFKRREKNNFALST